MMGLLIRRAVSKDRANRGFPHNLRLACLNLEGILSALICSYISPVISSEWVFFKTLGLNFVQHVCVCVWETESARRTALVAGEQEKKREIKMSETEDVVSDIISEIGTT